MKLTPTPVKEYAVTHGIPVYQPASCRDEAVLEELRAMEPEVVELSRVLLGINCGLLCQQNIPGVQLRRTASPWPAGTGGLW